tara:strand:- start:60698 stop:62704 length:2007 start_codon:yes stop_codon:yes gene_type:complete
VILALIVAPWVWIAWQAQGGETGRVGTAEPAEIETASALPLEAQFGPEPAFIREINPPDPSEYQFEPQNGVRYILVHREHDAQENGRTWYDRIVSQAMTTSGVSSVANTTVTYDPSFETLIFHGFTVYRDGEAIDKRDSTTIEFARRETRLARQMFDGRMTAMVRIDDVRVGDVVDFSYSRIGRNPALGHYDTTSQVLGFGVPVERYYFRSGWPSSDPVQMTLTGPETEVPVEIDRTASAVSYSFGPAALDAIEAETGAPAWVRQSPQLALTSFADWRDVAAWSEPFYRPQRSAGVIEVADQIRAAHASDGARLVAALRFVQDDVRYLATSFGADGYIPALPDQTLERRYGDCKAKTLLLLSILDELGIEAEAALVNTSLGRGLSDRQPNQLAFNHVIVRAHLGDRSYWLDGTVSEQGGDLDTLAESSLGFALPISGQGEGLVRMPEIPEAAPFASTQERFDLSADDGSAIVDLVMTGHGRGADRMRVRQARSGRGEIENVLLEHYNRIYGSVELLEAASVEDDRDVNVMVLRLRFRLPDALSLNEDGVTRELRGSAFLSNVVNSGAERDRVYPLGLGFPVNEEASIELVLPDSRNNWAATMPDRTIDEAAYHYSVQSERDGATLWIRYRQIVHAPDVDPVTGARLVADAAHVRRLSQWSVRSSGQEP